jgi:hypothetical protein
MMRMGKLIDGVLHVDVREEGECLVPVFCFAGQVSPPSVRLPDGSNARVASLVLGDESEGKMIKWSCGNVLCIREDHLSFSRWHTGLPEANFAKTRCLNGHPFDEGNTVMGKRGNRNCRACANIRSKKSYYERKKRKASLSNS